MMTEKEVLRCYTKYVYLDAVEFSKRSAEGQSEIVEYLNEIIRKALNDCEVHPDEHCILLPTGDGVCIAIIRSDLPYDIHIQISLKLLQLIGEHNKSIQIESRRFLVRIGINQNTDILITDINGRKNIAGAGINLAARIMDKADGGQIVVSEAVFHELQPSEAYMDKFKRFYATGKHSVTFNVYQYLGDGHDGLNTETPSVFASREVEKKLSETTAHYLAQAIMHREDILRIKESGSYWASPVIVLLRFLADDSYRISSAAEFESKPMIHTHGSGALSFHDQYQYYRNLDTFVVGDARDLAVRGKELALDQYSACFEGGSYQTHWEFVSSKGREKLKQDWPSIWEAFKLDTFVGENK